LEIVIVIVLAYFNKHGPNPSYTEDRTLSGELRAALAAFKSIEAINLPAVPPPESSTQNGAPIPGIDDPK
jgi:hypothetical protein